MRADHEYDDTMLVPLQSVSAGMRSRSVRNPFIYTQLIRLDLSNTISNFTHRYLRPVYRNASKWNKCIIDEYDTISMFHPISWCLNEKDRRWPIQLPRDTKLFPVALLVSVGVFLPVVVYAHTRHGHVLYLLATNEVERYAPFFLPFVSVFPVE